MKGKIFILASFISQFFFIAPSFGQYIYISSSDAFEVVNSGATKSYGNIWLKITDFNAPVQLKLTDGTTLNRYFKKGIHNPYFIVEHNKIRYRPNTTISIADTLLIIPQKTQINPVVETNPEKSPNQWNKVLTEVNSIPYEWEKSEKIIAACQAQTPPCDIYILLLQSLKYDASRVVVFNATAEKQDSTCQKRATKEVAEIHQSELILK